MVTFTAWLRRVAKTPTWEPLVHRPIGPQVAAITMVSRELIETTPPDEIDTYVRDVLLDSVVRKAAELERIIIAESVTFTPVEALFPGCDLSAVRLTADTAWAWRTDPTRSTPVLPVSR